jgi:flagellar protein FlgJ
MAAVDTTRIYSDFAGLAQLRSRATVKSPDATVEAAHQFEALFVQMMLQSMRAAGDVFGDDTDKSYRDMFDHQISLEMTRGKGVGLSDLLTRQLALLSAPVDAPAVGGISVSDRLTSATVQQALNVQVQPADLTPPLITTADPQASAPELNLEPGDADGSTAVSADATRQDWRPDGPLQFLRDLLPHALKAAEQLGIDPKAVLAHAALETGWGQKVVRDNKGVSSNNPFNVKAGQQWTGEQLHVKTLEYDHGVPKQKTAGFRAYPDLKSAFADYVRLLSSNPRYANAVRSGAQPEAFANSLQQAGYATDPDSAAKLRSILSSPRFEGLIGQLKKLVNLPNVF